MKKYFFQLMLALLLVGCGAPKFTIVQLGDKFSDPSKPSGFLGMNNRISSKSAKGGTHVDDKGVYIDPYVYKDKQTGKTTDVGFYITHKNFEISDGFNPIQSIIFLTDKKERVEIKLAGQDYDAKLGTWNSISKSYIGSFKETAMGTVSVEDFMKLATATKVEVKISGKDRSQTYDQTEVSDSFLPNLLKFYNTQLR